MAEAGNINPRPIHDVAFAGRHDPSVDKKFEVIGVLKNYSLCLFECEPIKSHYGIIQQSPFQAVALKGVAQSGNQREEPSPSTASCGDPAPDDWLNRISQYNVRLQSTKNSPQIAECRQIGRRIQTAAIDRIRAKRSTRGFDFRLNFRLGHCRHHNDLLPGIQDISDQVAPECDDRGWVSAK